MKYIGVQARGSIEQELEQDTQAKEELWRSVTEHKEEQQVTLPRNSDGKVAPELS